MALQDETVISESGVTFVDKHHRIAFSHYRTALLYHYHHCINIHPILCFVISILIVHNSFLSAVHRRLSRVAGGALAVWAGRRLGALFGTLKERCSSALVRNSSASTYTPTHHVSVGEGGGGSAFVFIQFYGAIV